MQRRIVVWLALAAFARILPTSSCPAGSDSPDFIAIDARGVWAYAFR